jgi:hypothetical protein
MLTAIISSRKLQRVVHAHARPIPYVPQNPPGMTAADEVINPDNGQPEGIACFATEFHARFRDSIVNFTQVSGYRIARPTPTIMLHQLHNYLAVHVLLFSAHGF